MKTSTAIMPMSGCIHAGVNGIFTKRRADRALFQITKPRRQSAGIQHQRQVTGVFFFHSAAADAALIVDFVVDRCDFAHAIVEHHSQTFFDVFAGEVAEFAAAFVGETEADVRLIGIGIAAHAGAIRPQISSGTAEVRVTR